MTCCRHPEWLYCTLIARGFAVDLVCKSPGISQDLLSISSFFPGQVPRFGRLLTPAANPLPINAKFLGSANDYAAGIRYYEGSCGSRLIEGSSGHYIRPSSGPSHTVVRKFARRPDRNNFLKTSRDHTLPDRSLLLLHGLTPSPKLITSREIALYC